MYSTPQNPFRISPRKAPIAQGLYLFCSESQSYTNVFKIINKSETLTYSCTQFSPFHRFLAEHHRQFRPHFGHRQMIVVLDNFQAAPHGTEIVVNVNGEPVAISVSVRVDQVASAAVEARSGPRTTTRHFPTTAHPPAIPQYVGRQRSNNHGVSPVPHVEVARDSERQENARKNGEDRAQGQTSPSNHLLVAQERPSLH